MKYIVIREHLGDIEKEVHKKIADGFVPIGGVCSDGAWLYQAMISQNQD